MHNIVENTRKVRVMVAQNISSDQFKYIMPK